MTQQQQQNLSDLDDVQMSLERWYHRTAAEMTASHAKFTAQLKCIEDAVSGRASTPSAAFQPAAPPMGKPSNAPKPQGLEWETLLTPSGSPMRNEEQRTPSLASPPVSHPINYEALMDDIANGGGAFGRMARKNNANNTSHNSSTMSDPDARTRPTPDSLPAEAGANTSGYAPSDRNMPCQVLVEFKRKRILQFESPYYVAPGEYVVVGGDRGEDIGLVTHSWAHGQKGEIPGAGRWTGGVGLGKVVRVANVLEVSQLQGVQTELELRAVDVAQEKVREHQLPMKIVDAEYQFDRKKLTFYYQSQHRLDFRNLVRDLYKTFRARIWMEQDIV